MKILELARKMLELGEIEKAQDTYILVADSEEATPEIQYEAAYFILQSGGDYKIAYTIFVNLFNQGHFQSEIFDILVASFYAPNVDKIKKLYHKNITRLSQYPYIYTKEFPYFDDLKIKFFPYDDDGFIPFFVEEGKFGEYINFSEDKEKYFFNDLSQPLKYQNIYSQFDLEYLYDNVRKSEWVAYDNHVYLHYTDKEEFAAYLQVLDFGGLIYDEKFVFLFDKEDKMYPIDFKKDYNIDYEEMTVKPLSISEIKRLVWHAQTNSHTGGDFFNEVFDGHPNLMMQHSTMIDSQLDLLASIKKALLKRFPNGKLNRLGAINAVESDHVDIKAFEKSMLNKEINDENVFIAFYIGLYSHAEGKAEERITPAVFFQPHYHLLSPEITSHNNGSAYCGIKEVQELEKFKFLRQFKYVRTMATFRRFTTRAAASYKFAYEYALNNIEKEKDTKQDKNPYAIATNLIPTFINNFIYVDNNSFLFKHSRAVRFEDGKLNPEATFTKLCEFLDLPYTQNMTYCSLYGSLDPVSYKGNVVGFSPEAVYRTYDEYMDTIERYLVEYIYQHQMEHLGYEPHYYDKEPKPLETLLLMAQTDFPLLKYQEEVFNKYLHTAKRFAHIDEENKTKIFNDTIKAILDDLRPKINSAIYYRYNEPIYVNENNEKLQMMKVIKPDPKLLITEVYK